VAEAQSFTYSFTGGNDGGSPVAGLIISGNTLYGTTVYGGASGLGTVFALNTNGTGLTTLHAFTGGSGGSYPESSLVLSGNMLYGTAPGVGTNSGTVFALNTGGAGFTVLHTFTSGSDGSDPQAGSLALSGNMLYGTAYYGGPGGYGTVFALNTNGTAFTVLYSFTNGADGANPFASVILSGNTLYGTAFLGGSGGYGTVFALNTNGTGFTTLHNFANGSDGANPAAGLLISGNVLYGAAENGGSSGFGAVFAVNTGGTGFTVLHAFSNGSDGANPKGVLILSSNLLYGTTSTGGGANYFGTAFALNTNGTGFAVLPSFPGKSDGSYLESGLVLSGNTLYGTSFLGGAPGNGTVFSFQLPLPAGSEVITWAAPAAITYGTALSSSQLNATANVPGSFAYNPASGAVLNAGTNALSVIFTPTDTVDYSSATNSVNLVVLPAPLTVAAAAATRPLGQANPVFTGTITGLQNGDNITAAYSCSATTGSPAGTYLIVPSLVDPNNRQTNYTVSLIAGLLDVGLFGTPLFTNLHSFTADPAGTNSDGANPAGGLVLSGNTLYGTADYGGSAGEGTVFAVNADGTGFRTLYSFTNGSDGAYPEGGLVLAGNMLYGTANRGGAANYGTVFSLNTNGLGFATLHSFTAIDVLNLTNSDGAIPLAGLVLSGNTLFGTTAYGGARISGTVFALSTNGTGFTTLHSFASGTDGEYPYASLIISGNTLYGTAFYGGAAGDGTVFALNTNGTGFTTLHSFSNGSDGAHPQDSLTLSGNTLYGTASYGGDSRGGTVFALNTNGTGFTTLHSFADGTDGADLDGGLILWGNTLYGTASQGGVANSGTVFALNTDGTGFMTLYSFSSNAQATNSDGADPLDSLIFSGVTLYGIAGGGGSSGNGTMFALALAIPPFLIAPPVSQTNLAGSSATFVVQAGGSTPLNYQWLFNGTNLADNAQITGSQSNILTLTGLTMGASGTFQAVVTNLYGSTNASATLTVFQFTPNITWPDPDPILYGVALDTNQLNATADVPGSFAYNQAIGNVLDTGTNVLSVIFTPADAVEYSSVTDSVMLVVLPAPLTVTASNASRLFGATNPVFGGTIAGLQNGDIITATYSVAATPDSRPGTYSIVPSLVDPNNLQSNYAVTLVNGTLTVLQAAPVVTWTNPAPIPYGAALASTQLNATASVAGRFVYNPASGAVLNAGTNALSVIFTPTDFVDYSSATDSVALVVLPASLTVTATNTSRPYGATNPVFGGTIAGLQNGDNITATYRTTATTNSPPGTYPIVPSLVDPNNRQINYTVILVNGTLTVTGTPPPVIGSVTQSGNLFQLTWSATATQVYQVQYATNLTQSPWSNLGGPMAATNSTATATDTISNSQKFYRVVLLP
jgi:uncharacterized repeat protein (TIGR03803 family)